MNHIHHVLSMQHGALFKAGFTVGDIWAWTKTLNVDHLWPLTFELWIFLCWSDTISKPKAVNHISIYKFPLISYDCMIWQTVDLFELTSLIMESIKNHEQKVQVAHLIESIGKIRGHLYVDLFGATFTIISMKRRRFKSQHKGVHEHYIRSFVIVTDKTLFVLFSISKCHDFLI